MVNIRPEDMSRAAYCAPASGRRGEDAIRKEAARADAGRRFGPAAALQLAGFFVSALSGAIAIWASPRSDRARSRRSAAPDPRPVESDLASLRDHNIIRHTARNLLTEARKQGSTTAPAPADVAAVSRLASRRSDADD